MPAGEPAPRPASVSVVICAYTDDRWADIVRAVQSVQGQSLAPLETIVAVDHNPRLRARVEAELPGVVVTDNGQERGLSGARNSGFAIARGDIVAFLDDDAWAEPDWLSTLAEAYADADVIGAGGAILPDWDAGRPRWWPDEFDWVVGCSYRGLPTMRADVRNSIGANMSFRRISLEAVGGFSHGIGRIGTRPLGGEETELAIRARRMTRGARIVYEPAATVHHRVPASRSNARYFLSRCYAEGMSKAAISRLVGAERALASERSYAIRTLASGVLHDAIDTIRRRDPFGPARAAWIVLGLATTTLGYLVASVSARPLTRTSEA
jgi:glycosyltransferase involved in cell wall biosynthesis